MQDTQDPRSCRYRSHPDPVQRFWTGTDWLSSTTVWVPMVNSITRISPDLFHTASNVQSGTCGKTVITYVTNNPHSSGSSLKLIWMFFSVVTLFSHTRKVKCKLILARVFWESMCYYQWSLKCRSDFLECWNSLKTVFLSFPCQVSWMILSSYSYGGERLAEYLCVLFCLSW